MDDELEIPGGWRWWLPWARYELSTPRRCDDVRLRLAGRLRGRNSSFWTRAFWRALSAGETILEGRVDEPRFWFNARWKKNVSGAIQTGGQWMPHGSGTRLELVAKPDWRWAIISVPLLAIMAPLSLLVLFNSLPDRPPAPWTTRILFPMFVFLGHVLTTRMMWQEIQVGRHELKKLLADDVPSDAAA